MGDFVNVDWVVCGNIIGSGKGNVIIDLLVFIGVMFIII